MTEKNILLSTTYFGPIHYYSRIVKHLQVYIEQFEHFNKQTFRNRCVILGANGPVSLVVPVVKGRGTKILIKDLKISYDVDWQRNQWQTIISAYNSSPYLEYYQDEISQAGKHEDTYWSLETRLKANESTVPCSLPIKSNLSQLSHF